MQTTSTALLLAAITLLPPPGHAEPPSAAGSPAFRSHVRPDVAAERRLRDVLAPGETVVALRGERFDTLGREMILAKVLNPDNMQIREVIRDAHGGAVDYDDVQGAAIAAWRTEHGAAHPAVVRDLHRGDDAIDVTIEAVSENDAAAVYAEVQALGGDVLELQPGTVAARVAPDAARVLARNARVVNVLPYEPPSPLALGIATDLAQGSLMSAHDMGKGGPITAAVWEPQACIRHSHVDFSTVTWPSYSRTGCSPMTNTYPVTGHSTLVAGVLGANRLTGKSGIFRGTLFEVPTADAVAEASMWQNAKLVNASFTINPLLGRTIDEQAYKRGIFVFNGAGNDAMPARCHAYNSLCVGGYVDRNTVGTFSDDVVWGGSTANDPDFGGREWPHVLGPVTARKTASWGHNNAYEQATGTSFATPGITGLAGLLLSNYSSALAQKPALMRAVLMASAQAHKIRENGLAIPRFNDGIDDRMGVGAPNGARAKAIMSGGSYKHLKATPTQLGLMASVPVNISDRVRVVLAWDQCPGYDTFDPQLKVDLDLMVREPYIGSTTLKHTNPSFVDNWEVVEFVAWKTGTITIHVSAARFDACAADNDQKLVPMAIAWTKEVAPPMMTMSPSLTM